MSIRHIARAAGLVALGLTSCASTEKSIGIAQVDDLVSRVERVHLEAELSKEAVYQAIVSMGALFADSFDGSPEEAFEAFAAATDECAARAETLRSQTGPMGGAANSVFERWEENLEQFSNVRMRERSANRLDATRLRFAQVASDSGSVDRVFGDLNRSLRDTVLFLGHDFNSFAVDEIEEDALAIRDQARQLGIELDELMLACEEYVAKSALRGQVDEPTAEVTVDE